MILAAFIYGLGMGLTAWWCDKRGFWAYRYSEKPFDATPFSLFWPICWAVRGVYFAGLWSAAAWKYARREK